jgi:acyl dehydratase
MALIDHMISFLGNDKLGFLGPVYPGDTVKYGVEAVETLEIDAYCSINL